MDSVRNEILQGDVLEVARTLRSQSVNCIVTSPPYFGLRNYNHPDQLGLEETPDAYVAKLVEVFRELRRVLRDDGVLWLNLGDSYSAQGGPQIDGTKQTPGSQTGAWGGKSRKGLETLPAKNLIGIPWLVAKALQQPYYTGEIKSECDRVWLAAMIDGEGTICGFRHKRKDNGRIRTGIHINITNTNISLLNEAYRIWPTSKQDHNMHGKGHKGSLDTYRWIAHNVEKKALLLRELYPYLIGKKQQAMLAWNLLEMSKDAKRLGRGKTGIKTREKRDWIVSSISDLNHNQQVDIPSWIKEPPSLYEPGWYLRSDVIWHKPNPMPESVTDRPTKAHEYLFLLTKGGRYYYDADAIREESVYPDDNRKSRSKEGQKRLATDMIAGVRKGDKTYPTRNRRTVWTAPETADPLLSYLLDKLATDDPAKLQAYLDQYADDATKKTDVFEVATAPLKAAHFAAFPPKLIEPCILAGCPSRVCVVCGEPWVRVVEKENEPNKYKSPKDFLAHEARNGGGFETANLRSNTKTKTLGFAPTCQCCPLPAITLDVFGRHLPLYNATRPGIVLDPFFGSGTTAQVAIQKKCDWLGIELNPEYIKLAQQRIWKTQPVLFSEI